jgi:hypothetical protein
MTTTDVLGRANHGQHQLDSGNIIFNNPLRAHSFSTIGTIREISPSGEVVQTIDTTGCFGYSNFRETLYGPPLRY